MGSIDQEPRSGIDILSFFGQDVDQADRIQLFIQAAELLRQNVGELTTPENIERINDTYDITVVFNYHAAAIDAGQIMQHIEQPFITFIESTGASDIDKSPQFTFSVDNAFDANFNHQEPRKPPFPYNPEYDFGYWEERALLAKRSLILPIDVRNYARHMLNAIIGDDYSQDYINSRINFYSFVSEDYKTLLEATKNRGLLVMYSNAVRELTSAKQIIDTLIILQDDAALAQKFSRDTADKTIALRDKARRNGKLGAYVVYGSGHHAFSHEFTSRGIKAKRKFANEADLPGTFKMIGTNLDQFFNAHHFPTSDQALDRFAKSRLLEDLLMLPSIDTERYGLFMGSRDSRTSLRTYFKILRLARSPELHDKLESILDDFKNDIWLPVKILEEHGITYNHLDSQT